MWNIRSGQKNPYVETELKSEYCKIISSFSYFRQIS